MTESPTLQRYRLGRAVQEGIEELGAHPRELVGLLVLAFLLMASYAISRPATESLFLGVYTETGLPRAWLVVALGMMATVSVYNHFAANARVVNLLVGTLLASAVGLVVLLVMVDLAVPGTIFALYIWKDIHIVVLVEIFWSIANVIFHLRTARWAYGLFCAAGAVGGISGNLVVGLLADRIGTVNTLWFVPILLGLVALGTIRLRGILGTPLPIKRTPKIGDAIRVIRSSSYLGLVVALIGLTQLAITLIDYVYNGAVIAAYPDMDERTKVIGWVYAAINTGSLVLLAVTGPLLRFGGVGRTLLGLPFIVGSAVVGHMIVPVFAMMAAAKITSKAFDYSIFRAAKEILYIPLTYREKVEGKAVADMLMYRVAKGGAAAVLMLLGTALTQGLVMGMTLALIVGWLVVTAMIIPRYHAKAKTDFKSSPCGSRIGSTEAQRSKDDS